MYIAKRKTICISFVLLVKMITSKILDMSDIFVDIKFKTSQIAPFQDMVKLRFYFASLDTLPALKTIYLN